MNNKFISLFFVALALSSTAMPTATMYVGKALHIATGNGDLALIRKLLKKGHNVNAQDWGGATPLHAAIGLNKLACFKEFIAHNADVNIPDTKEGWTPLLTAVNINNLTMVRILLEHGADVNAKIPPTEIAKTQGISGFAPLHLACFVGHTQCAKIILDHNPNIFARDDYSQTPLHVAVRQKNFDCIHLLMAHRAFMIEKLREAYVQTNDERFLKALIATKNYINTKDANDNTPLHYAAFEGSQEAAEILLNNGADIFARNEKKQTPLEVTLYAGQEIATILQTKEEVTVGNLSEAVDRLAMANDLKQQMASNN